MQLHPKFIIEGDNLILSKVTYHREIVTDLMKVKGGGWFRFNSDTNTFILYGESIEFGPAQFKDIKKCVENGKVYSNRQLSHKINNDYSFFYDSGASVIQLSIFNSYKKQLQY